MAREEHMELWGVLVGLLLALGRYLFDVDWDLRVKKRRRRKGNHGRA